MRCASPAIPLAVSTLPRKALLAWCLLGLGGIACLHSPAVWAQNAIQHRIAVGDTLQQLAQHYLGDASLWEQLQSHNSVGSPYRLRPGSVLEIPLSLMRPSTAAVHYLHGTGQVQRPQQPPAPLQPGMTLQEGDKLQLAPQAFVTVRLADGTEVRVQADSQLQLNQLRRRGRAGSLQSVLQLQQGGVDIQVPGKPDATRQLDVVTPVAATSVRGTTYNIQQDNDGRTSTALYQGRIAVQNLAGTNQATAVLAAGYGIAINAQGQSSPVTALLPAPDAQSLPRLNEDPQWLNLPLPQPAGATTWLLQISRDAQGQQVVRNGRFAAPSTAKFAAVEDGQYYLHARAVDTHGLVSPATTVPLRVKAHPVAPLTQVPEPSGLLAVGEAQLRCTQVDGAHNYRLQLAALPTPDTAASAADFASPALDITHPRCVFDLGAVPAGHYAWRTASLRVLEGQDPDQGPYAPAQTFRIAPRPAAPSAQDLTPTTQAGVTTLHWPAEAGQRFRLQALAHADDAQPALDTVLDTPSWTVSGLPAGQWHIRIQVQDPSGLHSAFSPPRTVTVLPLVQSGFGHTVSTGTGLGLEY